MADAIESFGERRMQSEHPDPAPMVQSRSDTSAGRKARNRPLPPLTHDVADNVAGAGASAVNAGHTRREALFGELHLRLLEQYGPPSAVVNELHEIVHLSENAGRYLQFVAGEPTANITKVIHPALAIELRTALFKAAQTNTNTKAAPVRTDIQGEAEVIRLEVRPMRAKDVSEGFFLVLFEKQNTDGVPPIAVSVNNGLKASVEELSDITRRKMAEDEMRESEVLRQAFQIETVGVLFFTTDGRITYSNDAFLKMSGYAREDLERGSLRLDTMTPPEFITRSHDAIEELKRTGKTPTYEKQYIRKDGTRWWGLFSASRLTDDLGVKFILDITDRKNTEEALRASEERVRAVADHVPQVIWTNDAEGNANYFNRRWYEYSGLSYEQSAGPAWQAIVHPDDEGSATERWQHALARGEAFDCEFRLRSRDGEYQWFIARSVPLRDESHRVTSWFGSAMDINDLKRTQADLSETDERFQLLIEGTPDYAMFLLNPDNIITYWSAGAEKVFGWTAAEAVGQSGELIFTPEDRENEVEEKEIEIALRDGRAPDRRWHMRKDGSRIWIDGVMRRIDLPDGSLRGFAKIARDATELRQAEEELRYARDQLEQRVLERTADLMATNNELERTMTQREQLERELLEISERERRRIGQDLHDIVCQELTATALYLKSAGNKSDHPEAAKTLDEAAEIVNRNVAIARDLARGFQPTVLGAGGLPAALRTLCKDAKNRRGLHCTLKLPRLIRVRDETIALNLFRIAQEAMRNAVTHSNGDEIIICIERERDFIRLVVEDNGKGFRPRKSSKGLGLHIMKYRANVLGGTLTISPRRKGGTKVVCEVPIKK